MEVEKEWKSRHRVIQRELLYDNYKRKLSIDIGSKEARQGDIAIDVNAATNPHIVADARCLPLRSNIFNRAFFTDVIEHLPNGTEKRALSEIKRVLKKGGELILTTPNDYWLYSCLDPARYVHGHRHYKMNFIKKIVEESGFEIERCFARGGFWQMIWVLYYCFFTYIFGAGIPHYLEDKVDREYSKKDVNKNGYTLFIKAILH